jgi:hypothetical protein
MRLFDMDNPHRYIKGTRYLHANWHNFVNVFDVRNSIIHRADHSGLSVKAIISFCSNALEAMHIASHISTISEVKDFVNTINRQHRGLIELRREEALIRSKQTIKKPIKASTV